MPHGQVLAGQEHRVAQTLASWLGAPFKAAWLELREKTDGKFNAGGLLITFLDDELLRIKFDRSFPIPSQYYLLDKVSLALASTRFLGEQRARQKSPRSVLQLVRALLENPPALDAATQIKRLLDSENIPTRLLETPTIRPLVDGLITRTCNPNTSSRDLLRILVGPVVSEILEYLRDKAPPNKMKLVAQILASHSACQSYWNKITERELTALLPMLSMTPGRHPFDEIRDLTGRNDAAAVLKNFSSHCVERLFVLANKHDATMSRAYYRILIPELKAARQAIESTQDPTGIIELIARLSQRRAALSDAVARNENMAPNQVRSLGIQAHTSASALALAPDGTIPAATVDQVFAKLLTLIRFSSGNSSLVGFCAQIDEILDWLAGQKASPSARSIKQSTFSSLVRRAENFSMSAALDVSWCCTLETEIANQRPFVFEGLSAIPLTSDRKLMLTGTRLLNCLRSSSSRGHYRNLCLGGRLRLFEIREDVDARPVATIGLIWAAGHWAVNELSWKGSAQARPDLVRAAESLAVFYTRLAPNPYRASRKSKSKHSS